MATRVPRGKALTAGLVLGVVSSVVAPREAVADERVECAIAYEQTQRLQQKAELVAGLDAAERCARPTCPALLKDDCSRWATELRTKLPKLVVRVRGADACAHDAAKVDVVGASRKDPDSATLFVDPGVHEVKVVDPVSSKEKTETINFAQGERRDIDVDFAPPGATCADHESAAGTHRTTERVPRMTLLLGGVGGGLLVLGGLVGLIGVAKRSDLDDCKPNCSTEQIDDVRPFFVAGDVIAGFGVLALGAAAVTFFAADKPTATSTRPKRLVFGPTGIAGTF